jgi:hypothetical protein
MAYTIDPRLVKGSGSYGQDLEYGRPKTEPDPIDPNAGKIFREGKWWTPDDYHNYFYKLGPYAVTLDPKPIVTPTSEVATTPANVTGYTAPAVRASANINIPNLSWSPTSDQLANWLTLGGQQAETEAAPQRQALTTGLERYTNSANEAKTSANTQYTNQELALANVVKNTMLKSAEENAIRRGAENSGWLGQQQQDIGRYETEQRAGIKGQANDYYNQLSNAVMAKQQETTDLLTELERVKGLRTNVLANQLQGTERGNVFQEKNQTFQNEYARGSMINSEEAQAAMNAYNNAALAAQIENNKWQQNFASEEFAANQAQQGFQNNLATASLNKAPTVSASREPLGYINTPNGQVPYYTPSDFSSVYNAVNKGTARKLTLAEVKAAGGTIMDYLMQD